MSVVGSTWSKSTVRTTVTGLLVLSVVLSLGVVVVWSPLALSALDTPGRDWNRLSAIGQTYGAASALLSGMAIVGVVTSLLLQAREMKVSRQHAQRALHLELVKMSLDEPLYMECWGPDVGSRPDSPEVRQLVFSNLIFSHWHMQFELGDLVEASLREECRVIFAGEPARRFWDTSRRRWPVWSRSRAGRRFVAIVEEEFGRSVDERRDLAAKGKADADGGRGTPG
jgi:hypothetical protein